MMIRDDSNLEVVSDVEGAVSTSVTTGINESWGKGPQ